LLSYFGGQKRARPKPVLRQSGMEIGKGFDNGKKTRGRPAAEGEGAPERGGQAAGGCRVGKSAGRHEGCLQK